MFILSTSETEAFKWDLLLQSSFSHVFAMASGSRCFHASGPIGSVRGPIFLAGYAQICVSIFATYFTFWGLEIRTGQVGLFDWECHNTLWGLMIFLFVSLFFRLQVGGWCFSLQQTLILVSFLWNFFSLHIYIKSVFSQSFSKIFPRFLPKYCEFLFCNVPKIFSKFSLIFAKIKSNVSENFFQCFMTLSLTHFL